MNDRDISDPPDGAVTNIIGMVDVSDRPKFALAKGVGK